jgi:hypothetical protein
MNSKNTPHTTLLSADRLAETILDRMINAARMERWGKAFMQIAWTAGPVTYLALQSGYQIAYGKSAPSEVFIYFAGYTVVAGIFALVARFFYNFARQPSSKDQNSLKQIFTLLPTHIIEIRDLQLSLLNEHDRRILATKYLLESPDADTESLATASKELVQNQYITELVRQSETYRRNGLLTRFREKNQELKELLSPQLELIRKDSEEVAQLIWQRISGIVPSKQLGRMRLKGFISRVLAAGENDDLDLMSLNDVEEVCIFAFELICGKRFPFFQFKYLGHKEYTDAAKKLTKTRREYWAAIYKRNSLLRVIAEMLYSKKDIKNPRGKGIHRMISSLSKIRSAHLLQNMVVEALVHRIHSIQANSFEEKKYVNPKQNPLRKLIEYYSKLRNAGVKALDAFNKFSDAWKNYVAQIHNTGENNCINLIPKGSRGRGIQLVEKSISINHKQMLPMARILETKLDEFNLEHEQEPLKHYDQKELAVDLLHIIDRYIPLGEIQTQQAIENTSSAYLTGVQGMGNYSSGQDWGLSLVSEVQTSRRQAIHTTLTNLVEYHNLEITSTDVAFLVEQYDADSDFINQLISQSPKLSQNDFTLVAPSIVPDLKSLNIRV